MFRWLLSRTTPIQPEDREREREREREKEKEKHLWFITPNYFEHINGVSTKYIAFFRYLDRILIDDGLPGWDVRVFHTGEPPQKHFQKISLQTVSSLTLPFYTDIKIPVALNLPPLLPNHSYHIVFHSEFLWLYRSLLSLQGNVLLIPNLHTDYDTYLQHYLQKMSMSTYILPSMPDLSLHRTVKEKLRQGIFHKIIVTGTLLEKEFQSEYANSSRSRCVFNANEIDVETFLPFYTSISCTEECGQGPLHIFYCGRLSVEKNLFVWCDLCTALYQIYFRRRRGSLRLHIIGSGPIRQELEGYLQEKGFDESIYRFYGPLSHAEIGKTYHDVGMGMGMRMGRKIFLFTSQSETFGKTCMEAMACGLPLFLLRSPIADAVYTDRKNAFLFTGVSEWIQSYEAFVRVCENHEAIEKLERRMRRLVLQYDQHMIFERWTQFLTR